MSNLKIPETVNIHIWPKCNLACVYCFGTFPGRPRVLDLSDWRRVIDLLAAAGVRRINFSGGEPTLFPGISEAVAHTRACGLGTSIVTNGARLDAALIAQFDLVALSIDSADDELSRRMGRVDRRLLSYREHVEATATLVHDAGVRLKINTVVCRTNKDEDLLLLYRSLRPWKVKLLQFTEVGRENDKAAPGLIISRTEFEAFAARHTALRDEGVLLVVESDETISSSYVMIDPEGRIFQHGRGGHMLSPPLLEVGLAQAMLAAGGYNRAHFEARGGHVDVRRLRTRSPGKQ